MKIDVLDLGDLHCDTTRTSVPRPCTKGANVGSVEAGTGHREGGYTLVILGVTASNNVEPGIEHLADTLFHLIRDR